MKPKKSSSWIGSLRVRAANSVSSTAPTQPGTYEVFASSDAASQYLAVASFDTTKTIVIGPKSLLQSVPSGKLPTIALVAGGKIKPIHVIIKLTLSTSPTGATGDPNVGLLSKNVKIKAGKTKAFGAVTIKTLPAGLTGTLYFIAKLTDKTGATNVIALPGSITAAAAFTDLAALSVATAPTAHIGKKLAAAVTLMQNGNIPFANSVPAELFLSVDGTMNGAIDLGPVAGHVSLHPGRKGVLHLTTTIPSSVPASFYHVIAKIDPGNTLSDTNPGNNVVSSLKTVIVS